MNASEATGPVGSEEISTSSEHEAITGRYGGTGIEDATSSTSKSAASLRYMRRR